MRQRGSVKRSFVCVLSGMLAVFGVVTLLVWHATGETAVLALGGALTLCAVLALVALMQRIATELQAFSDDFCAAMDGLIEGRQAPVVQMSEALFDRITQRLVRLADVARAKEERLDGERATLQSLVSDIAHQVRQPMANLQMLTDTLCTQTLDVRDRQAFLTDMRNQVNKLDFLIAALVKTSRLETGLITLEKRPASLYDTVAQALGGIVGAVEQKEIAVAVDCPEDLVLSHDRRWTAEALGNILDNAVKYTPRGGHIDVRVSIGELYVMLSVRDDGPGISESEQAQVFQRFYRAPQVHDVPGVGIGLYLAREIVMRQGGNIRLISEPGAGAEFCLMLPLWDDGASARIRKEGT